MSVRGAMAYASTVSASGTVMTLRRITLIASFGIIAGLYVLMSKDELQTLNVEALHQRLPCFSDIHPSAPIIFHYWLWIGKFSDLNL